MSETIPVSEVKVQSPFLPGTQIQYAWDSTSLGYLKGCPRLYYYTMIEGWQPKGEGIHLRFGIEYHTALQDYDIYRSLDLSHDEAQHQVVKELLIRTKDFNPSEEEYGTAAKYKSRQNLIRTVIWYLEKYPAERDPAKTYILENGKPAVELSFRLELDWGPNSYQEVEGFSVEPGAINYVPNAMVPSNQPYLLTGHLDRVVDYQSDLFFMDRKTTKSTPSQFYFSQYEPDNQMTLYSIAAKAILHSPVKGGIIDAAQVMIDASYFERGFTFRNDDKTEEWLLDLRIKLEENEHYAALDHWPMNDRHCNSYRSEATASIGCPFREVCSRSPRMREPFLKTHFNKLSEEQRWNPLKPR